MSTVATFFSGVAATTFQYTSGNTKSTRLDEIVRALWVSSLILSIASAINSQLAMHWRTAMYRSPRSALPMWTSLCLNQTPLLFLTFSVLTFSIGLVIYTYSSSQGKLVTLCATVLTSFTSLILLTVILWEGGERWQASKSGQMSQEIGPGVPVAHQPWEGPVEEVKHFNMLVGKLVWRGTRKTYSAIRPPLGWLFTVFSWLPKPRARRTELEYYSGDAQGVAGLPNLMVLPMVQTATLGGVQWNGSTASVDSHKDKDDIQQHWQMLSPPGELKIDIQGSTTNQISQDTYPFSPATHYGPHRDQRFFDSAWQLVRDPKARDLLNLLPMTLEGSRNLKSLKRVDYYTPMEGTGPVQDLQFAPDGKWIAASVRDGTVGLWHVDSGLTWNSALAAQQGSIAWHKEILRLLVPLKDGVEVWELGAARRKKRVKSGLEAFTWLQDGQSFVAVKENSLYVLVRTVVHSILATASRIWKGREYRIDTISCIIHYMFTTWRRFRLLKEEKHMPGLQIDYHGARWQRVRPKDVQPQRRIIVYDIEHTKVSAEVPVWGEAQHITVSRNGRFALVSYGSTAPPELWHIRISATGNVSLELCHMYLPTPKAGVDEGTCEFVGRASFGGDLDEYVVATTKG
ncbi:hypothetical protein FRC05_004841 [Tulasnella sp. 425]|nr:hypothetical protein FRC05_004841 [Tulasnella sp. 425]